MALNSSGPISLAGTTVGQSIEIENGGNGTTQISLNDAAVRSLAGVPSGAITMPTNFWGKANRAALSYTFSANTANASLNVTTISGYISGKSDITITINSGIYVYSTSTGTPGLTLTGGTSGDTITVVNNGYIMGKGGDSPTTYYSSGAAGGNAISLGYPTTINNTNASAYIGGGGGSGGINSGYGVNGAGGGAGGGRGSSGPGNTSTTSANPGSVGADGTAPSNVAQGGGGGRVFPGTGGAGGVAGGVPYGSGYSGGKGGGAGGGGAASTFFDGCSAQFYGSSEGGGGGWGASGGTGYYSFAITTRGGAGGAGSASGGNADANGAPVFDGRGGGAGGKAVALNGNTVTWTSGNTTRVYGAVS